jgi:kynurenine formamidase
MGAILAAAVIALSASATSGQTAEKGPWWPHPIWGAGDQAGGSNWITPEKILEAIQLVETGEVYELGHVYERGMPLFPTRTYAMFIPGSPTGGPLGSNNAVYHDEFLCAEIGQVGTQFDGPGHTGTRLSMEDGSTKDVFYNGFQREDMWGPYGLRKLGVENVRPYITRGILIDVAGYKNMETLAPAYEVTAEDIRGALAKQGLSEHDIEPGDALLFHYGWSKTWSDPAKNLGSMPGIGFEGARWVIDRKPSMVGSDGASTEVVPNPDASQAYPVHQELIVKNGIFNLENMVLGELARDGVYEFLFILTPIRFKGATGSPARPIAIR